MAQSGLNALFVASVCFSKLIGASRLHDEAEAASLYQEDLDRLVEGHIAVSTEVVGDLQARHGRMRDEKRAHIHQANAEDPDVSPELAKVMATMAEKQHTGSPLNVTPSVTRLPAIGDPHANYARSFKEFGLVMLRIQKTGTSTFSAIIHEQCENLGWERCDTWYHLDWNYVNNLVVLDPKRVIVTFVRNPVVRVISEGSFLRVSPEYAEQIQWDYPPDMYKRLREWIKANGTIADFANLAFNPANNRQVRYIQGFGRPSKIDCHDHCDDLWGELTNAGGVPAATATENAVTTSPIGAQILKVVKHRLQYEIDFFGVTDCFESSLKLANVVLRWDSEITKKFFDTEKRSSDGDDEAITSEDYERIKNRNLLDVGMLDFAVQILHKRAEQFNIEVVCENPHVTTNTRRMIPSRPQPNTRRMIPSRPQP